MPDYNPQPNEPITIAGVTYKVAPHPAVPVFAFGQEGRKAHVFQLVEEGTGHKFALKRFKLAYRVPELVDVNDALAQFARWEGLEVAKRQCLTTDQHSSVLSQYPDLEYAVLMPWVIGSTWYDLLIGMTPLTQVEAVTFAKGMADVLAGLEEAGLAHCDIAAANVILNPTTGKAHLIDIEDMYAPGFQPPAALPAGTDGYAHRTASEGLWYPEADRFAGAVILAEMLAWHDPRIRKASEEEHYFNAATMQQDSDEYRLMLEVLGNIDPRLPELLEQAWVSDTLADCPPMRAWQEVIQEASHRTRVAKVASEWRPLVPAAEAEDEQPEPDFPHPTDDISEAEEPQMPAPENEEEEAEAPAAQPQAAQPAAQAQPNAVQTQMPPPAAPAPVPVNTKGASTPVVEWRSLRGPQQAAPPDNTPQEDAPPPSVEFEPLDLSRNAAQSAPQVEFESLTSHDQTNEPDYEDQPVADSNENPVSITDDVAEENDELLNTGYYEEGLDETDNESHTYDEALELMDEVDPYTDETPPSGVEVDPVTTIEDAEPAPEAILPPEPADEALIAPEPETDEEHMPLTVPQLDYNNIDRLGRPHLVWTESFGATGYLLQESRDAAFDNPREFTITPGDQTTWNPTMPRTGRLFYRIKAYNEQGNDSAWSETVGVRIGER